MIGENSGGTGGMSENPVTAVISKRPTNPGMSLLTPQSENAHLTSLSCQLSAARSLAENRLERVHQLEKVLDQTLVTLEELKRQVRDQDWLENQLAYTEEFSQIQQLAIQKLNEQLQHYQDNKLDAHDSVEPESRESGTLNTTKNNESFHSSGQLKMPLVPDDGDHNKQWLVQVSLQQYCQELAVERDQYKQRVSLLEQQVIEMQEHILKQDQHLQESATAVQHWKDCSASSDHYASHLKDLLEQIIVGKSQHPLIPHRDHVITRLKELQALETNALLPSLLATFQPLTSLKSSSSDAAEPSSLFRPLTEDLPEFLARRRRNYYREQ
jgi:hypothetical protein